LESKIRTRRSLESLINYTLKHVRDKRRSETAPVSSNDDRRAFMQAMRNVRPLPRPDRAPRTTRPARPARKPARASADSREPSSTAVPLDDDTAFRRSGVSQGAFRQLRRGHLRSDAALDLHGLTVAKAQIALEEFMTEALRRGLACVRIVHGKGKGSGPNGPVLRGFVRHWLAQQSAVLAFVSAAARDGGSGAVIVLLQRR
jgi:DNA-nicking Smr family endonuclease